MLKLTTIFFLLESTLGWGQNDSIQVEKQRPLSDSIIINYIQRKTTNPATAGIFHLNNVQTSFHTDLFEPHYNQVHFGLDNSLLESGQWGVGFNYTHKTQSQFWKYSQMSINANGRIKIKKHVTRIGFGTEYIKISFDWKNATFGDMIDPRQGFIYPSLDVPRSGTSSGVYFHAGFIHTYKNLRIGASYMNLSNPNASVIGSYSNATAFPAKVNFNVSYSIPIQVIEVTPIIDISTTGQFTHKKALLLIQYRKKYFIKFGYQTTPKQYEIETGLIVNKKIFISSSYTISPRFLDYSQTLSIRMAYLFKPILSK